MHNHSTHTYCTFAVHMVACRYLRRLWFLRKRYRSPCKQKDGSPDRLATNGWDERATEVFAPAPLHGSTILVSTIHSMDPRRLQHLSSHLHYSYRRPEPVASSSCRSTQHPTTMRQKMLMTIISIRHSRILPCWNCEFHFAHARDSYERRISQHKTCFLFPISKSNLKEEGLLRESVLRSRLAAPPADRTSDTLLETWERPRSS